MTTPKQMLCLIVALWLALLVGCGPSPATDDTPPPPAPAETDMPTYTAPTLLADGMGTLNDLTITDAEVVVARERLDHEAGFIVFIASIIGTEYHFSVAEAARLRAQELDIPVEVYSARADAEESRRLLNDALARGAQVVIMDIFDVSLEADVQAALGGGVHMVQYAGRTGAAYGVVTISIEDAELGTVAGTHAGELIRDEFGGQANVAILDFPLSPQVVERADAIRAALLEVAPEAVIVGHYTGGTTEFGHDSMQQALAEHPEINVVVSINDAGAYGAYQVLSVAGRSRADTIIVGIDGEEQALAYIQQASMYRATVDTAPVATGQAAINAAIKLLAGSTLYQNVRVPVELITAAE